MTDRVLTICDQCGARDAHPKHHGPASVPVLDESGAPVLDEQGLSLSRYATKHYDCLSAWEDQTVRASAQPAGAGPKLSAIIDARRDGARGDDLLALIVDPAALPQAEGSHHQAQADLEGAKK